MLALKLSLCLLTVLILTGGLFNLNAAANAPAVICEAVSLTDGVRLEFRCSLNVLQSLRFEQTAAAADFSSNFGLVYEYGQPMLPSISRIVAVPPEAGLCLVMEPGEEQIISAAPPAVCRDEKLKSAASSAFSAPSVFPSCLAEMSQPFVIRGVRFARITAYPVRYDAELQAYRFNPELRATIRYTNQTPVSPGRELSGRRISRDFAEFIRAVAVNGDDILRDNGIFNNALNPTGYYLVVTNELLLPFVAPFIEWRRKAGYQVDILSLPDDIARADAVGIKRMVQARYDACLNQGVEPFDQILLVGDRSIYMWPPVAGLQLAAEIGETIWNAAPHADYKYACLEGNDSYMDAGVSRFCGGYEDQLDFMVGKTLAYEATPYMDDTRWFTRGAVYSQHWGNNPELAWHPTMHTNLRWATELLEFQGFDDVRFYEDYDYDQDGRRVAPFVQTQFNEGVNLLLGRAENLYWAQSLNGIDDNVVFPLRLNLAGHGEYATWQMMRLGSGEHLKGPVASTCGWGGPPTISTNAVWLEMVSGMIQHDLSYGWTRVYATTVAENYFPNFQVADMPVYGHIKTDSDFYGDPGLRHWRGVPTIAAARFPAEVPNVANSVEVQVFTPGRNTPLPDALVTLYAPGEMPDFNDQQYAAYQGMEIFSEQTDAQGNAAVCVRCGAPFPGPCGICYGHRSGGAAVLWSDADSRRQCRCAG